MQNSSSQANDTATPASTIDLDRLSTAVQALRKIAAWFCSIISRVAQWLTDFCARHADSIAGIRADLDRNRAWLAERRIAPFPPLPGF